MTRGNPDEASANLVDTEGSGAGGVKMNGRSRVDAGLAATHGLESSSAPQAKRGQLRRNQLGSALPWLRSIGAIVLLIIFFSIVNRNFMTVQNWQNILSQMAVLLVISVGGTFPILVGGIDLSVGSTATLCGILAAMTLKAGGVESGFAVLVALGCGLGVGLFNALLLALVRIPSFLVTLGSFFMVNGIASFIIKGYPVAVTADWPSRVFDAHYFGFPTLFMWAFVVLLIGSLLCRYTRLGRHFYAVGGSEPAALLAGINVKFVKIVAFALSGLLAGFAGFLLSVHILSGSPEQGAPLLLPSIGAIVIGGTTLSGGIGGPQRTLIGVLLLTVLINGMQLTSVDPFLQLVVEGAVVIVAVVMSRQKLSWNAVVK